jgi:riboflavin kinase/FMN adenylyltransferase
LHKYPGVKIYHSINDFKKRENTVVTTGTFDGVHTGHRKIISRLTQLAKKQKGESAVLTFFPHPRMVLHPDDHGLKLLNTLDERIELLGQLNIDHLIVHTFTKEFSRTTFLQFVRDILVNAVGTKTLVIGYDHHFGRNREGTYKELAELAPVYDFKLEKIDEEIIHEITVSSTKIRAAIDRGDIELANELLGYEYMLSGKVVRGDGIGKVLGYPTANIKPAENYKMVPADGIYAVRVRMENENYSGMLYIGTRPTLNMTERNIEVNIFNFDKNIYDKNITVTFCKRIRDDIRFSSKEELSRQLGNDKEEALKILAE